MTRGRRRQVAGLAVGLVAALAPLGVAPATADQGPPSPGTAVSVHEVPRTVLGVRRLGRSVSGRPIRAFHLGDPSAEVTAVVLGAMHGNEQAGIRVVDALRTGPPVAGVDLWVIRTINPDGVARNTRGNARGVDLNRNFGHDWAPLTGSYYSGPRPYSEPESRALRDFLNRIDPTYVVSFHQPLHGVGRAGERRPFVRRLARGLGLPVKSFHCTGQCHGTMSSWFNARHDGTAVTVEFGASPSRAYLRGRAADGTVRAVLGTR